MILGVGIDHCQISRMAGVLQRYSARLEARYFVREVAYCSRSALRRASRFAMFFAAKEATSKALGTGFRDGVSLSTIEVIHLPSGQPSIVLHGAALGRLQSMLPPECKANISVSLTDEADIASAIVVIEAT